MAISTNGTVIARLAGGLYNTVMSNATYLEVAAQDPSTLANTLYARDFAKSTDLAVATTLVTNLGLSSVAGLDNWVAAQLTAAGSAKGAKIVSLLNDFAGMAADPTYGAAATAFNTKVDAALASSQRTGAVEAKFETAGVVATTNAIFTLTTGTDALSKFTGGAGDDTFNATNADLGVLDSIDGGSGTDTLSIVDSVSIPARNITATGIETVVVNSTAGSVGAVAATAKIATKEKVTFTFNSANYGTSVGAGPVKVTVGGATTTAVNATAAANAVTLTELIAAINDLAGASIASAAGDVITVTSATAGTALPVITFANGSYTVPGSSTPTSNSTIDTTAATNYAFKTTLVANQEASAAVVAATFAVPTGATTATLTAKTTVGASAPATAAVTAKGTVVQLSGGLSQTVTASNSAQVSGSAGIVKVTASLPSTALAAVSYTGWAEAAGVFVRGGSTVSVTETAGAFDSGTASAGNATKIQIGSTPASAYGASGDTVSGATATGYPTLIGNLDYAPTGDVTTSVKTSFTDDAGAANITYGTGAVEIYMNGGSTASVTGASTVIVRDMQSVATKASSTATAAPAAASNLTTVNLTGVSGATDIYSDALTSVSVVDSSTTVTVNSNFGKNATALNVSVGNSTATVSASQATSVAITGVESANAKVNTTNVAAANSASTLTLTAAKAKSVSFAGSSDITLASSTLTVATAITASGSGKLDLGTPTGYSKVTSVDGSAATGKIIASLGQTIAGTPATDRAFAFTSGSGNDTVTLTATQTSGTNSSGAVIANSVNLGGGDDVLLSSSGAIGTGATANGGDGSDTVAASLLTVGNASRITNFEVLGLDKPSGSTYDSDLLSGATGLHLLAQGATYNNVEQAQSLKVTSNIGSSSTTLSFTTSNVAGVADSYAVTFNAEGGATTGTATTIDAGTLVIEGIENVTINSGVAKGFVDNTIDLTSEKLKSVTLTGAAYKTHLGFAGTNGTNASSTNAAVKSIDGSSATGRLYINTSNVIEDSVSGLTVTGGSGADELALDATLTGTMTANGGAGNDTITLSGSMNATLTGGDGKDTFNVSLATIGVSNASGADSALVYAHITDFATGDVLKIDSTSAASNAYLNGNAVSGVQNASTLTAAIDAALQLSTVVPDATVYFTYGGNTYIAHEDSTDGLSINDVVVKLTGTLVLAASNVEAAATGLFGTA